MGPQRPLSSGRCPQWEGSLEVRSNGASLGALGRLQCRVGTCFRCKVCARRDCSLGVYSREPNKSPGVKLGVGRSTEVAGSQALRTDGVPMSTEAGRAFQTEQTAWAKNGRWGSVGSKGGGASRKAGRLAPSREDEGRGAQGPWWRGHTLPIPGATWAPCSWRCGCGMRRCCPLAATSPWCGCCAER